MKGIIAMLNRYTVVNFLIASFLIAGCVQDQPGELGDTDSVVETLPDEPSDSASEALTDEMDAKFNAYVQAVFDNNTEALDGLISREIKLRARQMGSNTAGFTQKMSTSMLRQFPSIARSSGVHGHFTVESVHEDGEALRVNVAFDGAPLPRPFYFVREDGEYKMNLLQPGFSNQGNALSARRRYLIKNNNDIDSTIHCNGGEVNVPSHAKRRVTCNNTCGWFRGSTFWVFGGPSAKCDWNTWGVDVYIDDSTAAGFYCHDECQAYSSAS